MVDTWNKRQSEEQRLSPGLLLLSVNGALAWGSLRHPSTPSSCSIWLSLISWAGTRRFLSGKEDQDDMMQVGM